MATWLCIAGTRLLTLDGPVTVERLLPGAVLTAQDGTTLRAEAIGRIRLSVAELLARSALWPVRIAAGALGAGEPDADVVALADQPLTPAGVAAKWLVDGVGLTRPAPVAALDVYSLSVRGAAVPAGGMCLGTQPTAPRPPDAVLFDLRRQIGARGVGAVLGSIDAVSAGLVEGWADDGSGRPVALELVVDGVVAPPVAAGWARADLAAAGIGDGRRGFAMTPDPPLDPRRRHLLRVRRALDGADVPGSPVLLDAVVELAPLLAYFPAGPELRQAIGAAARRVATRLAALP